MVLAPLGPLWVGAGPPPRVVAGAAGAILSAVVDPLSLNPAALEVAFAVHPQLSRWRVAAAPACGAPPHRRVFDRRIWLAEGGVGRGGGCTISRNTYRGLDHDALLDSA